MDASLRGPRWVRIALVVRRKSALAFKRVEIYASVGISALLLPAGGAGRSGHLLAPPALRHSLLTLVLGGSVRMAWPASSRKAGKFVHRPGIARNSTRPRPLAEPGLPRAPNLRTRLARLASPPIASHRLAPGGLGGRRGRRQGNQGRGQPKYACGPRPLIAPASYHDGGELPIRSTSTSLRPAAAREAMTTRCLRGTRSDFFSEQRNSWHIA